MEQLTRRQNEILRLAAQGLRNQEIAAQLGISYQTVKNTLKRVYSKLEARNRIEAILKSGIVVEA